MHMAASLFNISLPILKSITKSALIADDDWSETGFHWFSIEIYWLRYDEKKIIS